jgi:signal transduction histidine kinase
MLRESHERLQHLAAGLIDVREQERSAIARELHDELGQALTRLNMDLMWLAERVPLRLRNRRTAGMVSLVEEMLTTVQHLSSQLRPAILDDFGLEAAIEWQAQEFEQWNGARCRLDLRLPPLPPDRDRDTTVFRILQESLTNVARHSGASSVQIALVRENGEIALSVKDDGRGFSPEAPRKPDSYGLMGLRERAHLVGGKVRIDSAPGQGVRIDVRIPLEQPGPDQ